MKAGLETWRMQREPSKCSSRRETTVNIVILTAHSAGASTLGAKHVLGVRIQQSLASHFDTFLSKK